MSRGRKFLVGTGLAVGIAIAGFFWLGSNLESFVNRVEPVNLPEVSDRARALHQSSLVADLHADSLMFGRDLLERSDVGHVDLPRLQEGGVGLQFFTAPTIVPLGFNVDRTDAGAPDLLTLMGWAQLSPFAWRGALDRALLQAERLQRSIAGADGQLVPVRTVADLDQLLARRRTDPGTVGAVLGIEGAHALEGDPDNVNVVFDAGFRMIGLTHFFDNRFAGSAHGVEKGGLTRRGKRLVERMEALGMLVDLAHLSPAAIDDVLAATSKPIVVSHGGVKGTCDNLRNISDTHVRAIARRGGVIGIGYWDTAVCGTEPRHVVAAIRHVVELAGDDHAALGSDFDGAITPGFDTTGLPALTQAMLDAGFSEESIGKILGGNAVRVLRQVLPATAVPEQQDVQP